MLQAWGEIQARRRQRPFKPVSRPTVIGGGTGPNGSLRFQRTVSGAGTGTPGNRLAAGSGSGGSAGTAIGITVAVFVGILVLVALLAVVVLYAAGPQIANVFSNVAAALSTPSP